jgi:hypothetical protein
VTGTSVITWSTNAAYCAGSVGGLIALALPDAHCGDDVATASTFTPRAR